MLLGQEVHYYMIYIAYFTELNLKICDYAQKDAFVAKIVNTRLTNGFMATFAPAKSLPSPATLPQQRKAATTDNAFPDH